jgi:hypothetical protein
MTAHNLPTIPLPATLHARLVTEARRRGCGPADLVRGPLVELVDRLEAEELPHAPTPFCFCGGTGCSRPPVVEVVHGDRCQCAGAGCALRVSR